MWDIFGFTKSTVDDAAAANVAPYHSQQQANAIKDDRFKKLFEERTEQWGVVRVETWPEGLVIYVGGVIVYRSWRS